MEISEEAAAAGGIVLEDRDGAGVGGIKRKDRRGPAKSRSNSQRKKEERMARSRVKKRARSELMVEVARTNLPAHETKLLKSSSLLGRGATRGTVKEQITREFKLQRAGVRITSSAHNSRLLVAPRQPAGDWVPATNMTKEHTAKEQTHNNEIPDADRDCSESSASRETDLSDPESQAENKAGPAILTSTHPSTEMQKIRCTSNPTPGSNLSAPTAGEPALVQPVPIAKRTTRERRARVTKSSREFATAIFSGGKKESRPATEALQARIMKLFEEDEARSTGGSDGETEKSSGEHGDSDSSDTSGSDTSGSDNETSSLDMSNDRDHESECESISNAIPRKTDHSSNPRKKNIPSTPASKTPSKTHGRTKFVVHVDRRPELAEARMALPVCAKEQEIMEAVHQSDIVLISGATGSGKTTQVPQFLYEAGFGDTDSGDHAGKIAVVQPRRVAVMSCARRVAHELNLKLGNEVGYQIRHSNKTSKQTKLLFLTDGILLKELEEDFLMRKYSAIIIDEAHERSLNTDMLLVLLSKSTQARRSTSGMDSLKVIIMSATLDLHGLFGGSHALLKESVTPVIELESRQYPVTMHFSRRTPENYVHECIKKVSKLHKKLPPGDVLVFVTGRLEVQQICRELNEQFEDRKTFVALPLYSMLPEKEQRKVFKEPVSQRRKVVVSTNVAETSLTIPGISYVVDSGKAKEKVFKGSVSECVSTFEVDWISKASAAQRSGRAGRMGPGHCYRLYSSAVFQNDFADYREPEAVRIPVDALVLKLRAMGISNIDAFPLPSRPPASSLLEADRTLRYLGAFDNSPGQLALSPIGSKLAQLPISPRLGRFLLSAYESGCFHYAARIAAALSVGELFQRENADSVPAAKAHALFTHPLSEALTSLRAVAAAEHAMGRGENLKQFCQTYALHFQNLKETLDIGAQLERLFQSENPTETLEPPSQDVETKLRQCLLSGFPDHIGRRVPRDDARAAGVKGRRALQTFSAPQLVAENIFLSGNSAIPSEVEFVCFSELTQNQPGDRITMRNVTAVSLDWIPISCESLCSFDEPSDTKPPNYNQFLDRVTCFRQTRYGPQAWNLGLVQSWLPDQTSERLQLLRFQVAGQGLLEGCMFPSLKWMAPHLTVRPSDCLLLSSKAKIVVVALKNKGCSSRADVEREIQQSSAYLYPELATLLPMAVRVRLKRQWPPKEARSLILSKSDGKSPLQSKIVV